MAVVIFFVLAALAHLAERSRTARDNRRGDTERLKDGKTPVYALLPGDIKYESPNGNVRFYFPVTTSIVLSIVLTLLLRILS